MTENNISKNALPKADENIDSKKEIEPLNSSQAFIPVKFNKEIINLTLEKAQELAQKGMKFDMIANDYEALRRLAKENGKNVNQYISDLIALSKTSRLEELTEKCGGNTELAEHILKLESDDESEVRGFSELKESFPKIKNIEALPESVVEAARLKGTLLLDEYLRFLHKEQIAMKESLKKQNSAGETAVGPFAKSKGDDNPEAAEFLRGLWQK